MSVVRTSEEKDGGNTHGGFVAVLLAREKKKKKRKRKEELFPLSPNWLLQDHLYIDNFSQLRNPRLCKIFPMSLLFTGAGLTQARANFKFLCSLTLPSSTAVAMASLCVLPTGFTLESILKSSMCLPISLKMKNVSKSMLLT